jgi:hypothetical protein
MRRQIQPDDDGITRIGDILRRYEQQYLGGYSNGAPSGFRPPRAAFVWVPGTIEAAVKTNRGSVPQCSSNDLAERTKSRLLSDRRILHYPRSRGKRRSSGGRKNRGGAWAG